MATELGQAYVQIIPSAKGISGAISSELKGESEAAGKAAGFNIVSTIKKVLVTAGIGKALVSTIKEGGKLEQSLGGIETLFKDNANTVKKYAQEAYKTVGLSANTYMENVTGFSASLLQSLGGDTEKAAKVAHMAMVDMSDNSNKMGTDMRDIQNAYQGFAKQNYTMLDNLKLGYGGTKEEMQRLLADAEKLTGVKYDINNLSDVYEAIHAVQEEIGITGTTALEAEETISGSFAAMKGAFQNVLGSLALGENIRPSLEGLAQTISTFLFDNLFPMIGRILLHLPEAFLIFIQEITPRLMEMISNLLDVLGEGTGGKFLEMMGAIKEAFTHFFEVFRPYVEGFILDLVKFVSEHLPQIKEIFSTTLKAIKEVVRIVTGVIADIWRKHGDSILKIVKVFWGGIKDIISGVLDVIQGLVKTFLSLLTGDWKGAWEGIKQITSGLLDIILGIFKATLGALAGIVTTGLLSIKAIWSTQWETIKRVVSTIWEGIKVIVSRGVEAVSGTVTRIFGNLVGIVSNIWRRIYDAIVKPIEWARDAVHRMISDMKGFFNFSWRLPDISLPHIRIDGQFSLNPPQVPHFSLDWYKEGGIFDSASIIGVGEAGSEAVLPTHKLDQFLYEAVGRVSSSFARPGANIDEIIDLLERLLDALLNQDQQLVLDSGALVGELIQEVDNSLGVLRRRRERGE